MPARKYSASMDSELLDDVEAAARDAGLTVSAWIAQCARDRLGLLGLQKLIDDWEAEHGAFTEEEMAQAHYDLNHPLDPREVMREHRSKRSA